MKEKSAAIVTIKDAPHMSNRGRRDIAAWLRRQAGFLERSGSVLNKRFTARYIYTSTVLVLFAFAASGFAQEVTNIVATNAGTNSFGAYVPVVPAPDVSTAPLPASTFEFWTYAIAVIVPLLVGGMKKLVPKIPTWVLPVSTPFVGLLLGFILKWIGAANLSWVDMAQAGGLAVLIRESWNQIITTPIKGEEKAKTVTP